MNITKAIIIKGVGSDKVALGTDLPEPTWPFEGKLTLQFNASADTGEDYVRMHWPDLPVEIIKRAEIKHG